MPEIEPAAEAAASEKHAEVFAQLVRNVEAFLVQYDAAMPIAHLVWEAAVLGFCHGTQHAAGRSWQETRADYLKDHTVVAGVLDYATVDGVVKFPALRALALADSRAEADGATDNIINEGA